MIVSKPYSGRWPRARQRVPQGDMRPNPDPPYLECRFVLQRSGLSNPELMMERPFEDGDCLKLRLTPTESEGTQFNPQRADESRALKNVLHNVPVRVFHSEKPGLYHETITWALSCF